MSVFLVWPLYVDYILLISDKFLFLLITLPLNTVTNLDFIPNREKIEIPGRPIISQCGSPMEYLDSLLEYFLLPIGKRH